VKVENAKGLEVEAVVRVTEQNGAE